MKDYFPFTDYEFYAYLTSGILAVATWDYAFNGSLLATKADWSFIQIVGAVAIAYVIGHGVATLSQLLLETLIVNHLFAKPIGLQLGFTAPRWHERIVGVLVGRYYEPISESTRDAVLKVASATLQKPKDGLSAEDVFQVGFRRSLEMETVRARTDDFRNQYGFARNVCFVAFAAAIVLACRLSLGLPYAPWAVGGAALIGVLLFVRYVKFLASFQMEIVRTLLIKE